MNDQSSSLPPYRLLDFGFGRKLEMFGGITVDRPSPPAESFKPIYQQRFWSKAHLRFDPESSSSNSWVSTKPNGDAPSNWQVDLGFSKFDLQCSPVGQLGIFPEQRGNWKWIRGQKDYLHQQNVLNLFAYTGGSTLAAASVGAHVTHVDSAKNIVQRARNNAANSSLGEAPIRWIVDDVCKFVAREIKRGKKYRAVFLDPPSYGHGTKNESWQIDRDLEKLIFMLGQILEPSAMVLLTCHSPGFDAKVLSELCAGLMGSRDIQQCDSGEMNLDIQQLDSNEKFLRDPKMRSSNGKQSACRLQCGYFARVIAEG